MTSAKALAAAISTLVVFVVGQFGLDLPEGVQAALQVLVVTALVYLVPNKKES